MNRRDALHAILKGGAVVQAAALPKLKAFAQQLPPSNTGTYPQQFNDPAHPPVNDDTGNADHIMPHGMMHPEVVVKGRPMAPGSIVHPCLTRGGGNLRHNTYLNETRLTPDYLAANPLKIVWTATYPDDARGCESQPLFVPNVSCPDGITRNLMLSSTMSNHVIAHDAKAGYVVWSVRLGNPILGSGQIDGWGINQYWGILSTGVVIGDVWYVVAWTSSDGTAANATHWLYAVSIHDGSFAQKPILLYPKGTMWRKQRASLLAIGTNLFIPWGTVQETAKGAHGFITAVDTVKWQIIDELSTTATGSGAGIWQAGQGLVEYNGKIYALTGNGDYDGKNNFGESFIEVQLQSGKLNVTNHYCPWQDKDRSPGWGDQDLGSGPVIVLEDLGLICGAGKDGILYVLDLKTFQPKTAPIFMSYFRGFGVSAQPANIRDLDISYGNVSHHIHSTSVYWNKGLWCMGENGNLRLGKMDATGKWNYIGRSTESASVYSPVPPGGMPGGFMCLSANGNQNGIVWVAVPDGDANKSVTTGRIFAFDAQNMGPKLSDGDIQIKRLWMSDDPPAGHQVYNKFLPPQVNDGCLYWTTYDGKTICYA